MGNEITQAIINAGNTIGVSITTDIAAKVLLYSITKCKSIGKDPSYLPILFENELVDFYTRAAINAGAFGSGSIVGGAV